MIPQGGSPRPDSTKAWKAKQRVRQIRGPLRWRARGGGVDANCHHRSQKFGESALDAFIERGDTVAGAFCTPEKPGGAPDPLRVGAEERGIRVFQFPSLKTAEAKDALRGLSVDLGVMAYVLQFAPQDFTEIPRHGMIQYHPSLLPKYRGPSSINWPIIRGDTRTGLTIFRPSDGLDEGPVLLQKTPIGPDDTLGSVYFDRLYPMGVEALKEAAVLVVAGRAKATVQDELAGEL